MFRKLSRKRTNELVDALGTIGRPFASETEAEAYYAPIRDMDAKDLAELAQAFPELEIDFKATSLKRLEQLYFEIHVDRKKSIPLDRNRMEQLMTAYTRKVFVRNGLARWHVVDNDFNPGNYTDGLEFTEGGFNNNHFALDLLKECENPGRDRLFRSFMMYVPVEREAEVM